MVLNIAYADLFNTILQYSSVVQSSILYQPSNASGIPSSLWSDGHSSDWLEGVGGWNFPDVSDCLETIFSHLRLKLNSEVTYNSLQSGQMTGQHTHLILNMVKPNQ